MHELVHYALYLKSFPNRAAALLAVDGQDESMKKIEADILLDMCREWHFVTRMEEDSELNKSLKKLCPYTRFASYRELMYGLQASGFRMNEDVRSLISAWYPRMAFSCNIETMFNHMEDCIKRATKTNKASMANMQALSIRAFSNRICKNEHAARTVSLLPEDFEGKEVRCIKPKVWRPDNFSGSFLARKQTTCPT